MVGAFAEVSPDIYAISDLVASVLADEHCSYFSEKPSAAKAMFTQKLYRSLGLTAHLGWARLLVDRYRDLVQIPAAARQQTSSRHNTPHHFTPDDEDAYEHDAYLNPASPHPPLYSPLGTCPCVSCIKHCPLRGGTRKKSRKDLKKGDLEGTENTNGTRGDHGCGLSGAQATAQ